MDANKENQEGAANEVEQKEKENKVMFLHLKTFFLNDALRVVCGFLWQTLSLLRDVYITIGKYLCGSNLNLMSNNVGCTGVDRVFFVFFVLFMNIVCVVLTSLLFSANDSNFT